jgi:hypothetical protein
MLYPADVTAGLASGSQLPPDVAALGELFAERIGAGSGRWRLELFLENGRIRKWLRQEEGGRTELARFDEEAD